MTTDRRTALLAGALYLVTFASSIPAVALLAPVLDDPLYVLGAGADTRVVAGLLLDLVNAAACVGTAVVLHGAVRRTGAARALGFVASRLLEAAVIALGVVSLLAVVTLRQAHAAAPVPDPEALVVVASGLVAVRDWTFLLGPGLVSALNALLLGSLVLQGRLVPRAIPLLGLVGAPLQLASVTATLFGANDQLSALSAVAVAPIALWELSFGLWLVTKGLRTTTPSSAEADGAVLAPVPAASGPR